MKLSIIIPYYDTYEETKKLLETLIPQLTNEIEILIIDDGCNEVRLDEFKQVKVIHLPQNSGGASKSRNIGLDIAIGEYIAFIDSDDMVTDDYISHLTRAIATKKDIIYISWKSTETTVKMAIKPPKWNCAVWCRVYKRKIIGKNRFDESLRIAEDWKFNQNIKPSTSYCIKDIIYFYNIRPNSLIRSKKND